MKFKGKEFDWDQIPYEVHTMLVMMSENTLTLIEDAATTASAEDIVRLRREWESKGKGYRGKEDLLRPACQCHEHGVPKVCCPHPLKREAPDEA